MTDDRENPALNTPVPVAEDNPQYFNSGPSEDGSYTWFKCQECEETSKVNTVDIKHKQGCLTWLRMRLETQIVKYPHLKFQLTKLMQLPLSGSYPVYVAHLVAPFVVERGTHLNGDYQRIPAEARAPIKMTKAEMNNKDNADKLFKARRVEATHKLLDFVESGEVPVQVDGKPDEHLIPSHWGVMSEIWPDEQKKLVTETGF